MKILEDHPLQDLNSFRIPSRARYLVEARSVAGLREALAFAERKGIPVLVLGGGSNIVFTRDFPGLVIRVCLAGIERLAEGPDQCLLRVAAGEPWPSVVEHCLEHGWFGLENLGLIPGTAGAAPIQNIGAYGMELADRLEHLETLDRSTGRLVRFTNRACRFSYRDSAFKGEFRDRHVIVSVTLRLHKTPGPVVSYESLKHELETMGVFEPTPHLVYEAVGRLRRKRLPDPAVLGNAGSFFKNPVVPLEVFESLRARFPGLPAHPVDRSRVRLAAAWMIDRLGWRGVRRGAVGVHTEHALVLVNHGGASGREVLSLAREIRDSVRETFGVNLEIEPRIY